MTVDHDGPVSLTLMSMFDRGIVERAAGPGALLPVFATLDEAREELEWYWHSFQDKLYFVLEAADECSVMGPNAIQPEQPYYREALAEWFRKFSTLFHQVRSRLGFEQGQHFVRMEHYHRLFVLVNDILGLDESLWDDHTHDFERILDACQALIASHGGVLACHDRNNEESCAVQTNNGVVAVLLHVFWKCRAARVRQRALHMLVDFPRPEFLWDSPMVTDIARHIEELERGQNTLHDAAMRDAHPAEIPQWRRIRAIGLKFDSIAQTSELTYVIWRSATDGTEVGIKRVMRW